MEGCTVIVGRANTECIDGLEPVTRVVAISYVESDDKRYLMAQRNMNEAMSSILRHTGAPVEKIHLDQTLIVDADLGNGPEFVLFGHLSGIETRRHTAVLASF